MDTASAKALLQSTDIMKIKETAQTFAGYSTDDPALDQQYLKLQILLWNRVLQLQKQQSSGISSSKEQAATLSATATVWMRMGEMDRAMGQLHKAVELQPTGIGSVKMYQLLGQAAMTNSDYDKAAEHHTRAISELVESQAATQYDLALAYSKMAGVYEAQSEFQKAMDWLHKAVEASDSIEGGDDKKLEAVATVQAQLGTLKEKLGEYKESVDALTKAHDALVQTKGKDHSRTKEVAFLLDMAASLAE